MKQERVSTSSNSTRSLESLRSRYHAFLEKRKSPKPPKPPSEFARFGQGLVNFAIFFGLFIAILTVFGLGLSWYSRAHSQKSEEVLDKPVITEASASILPSPPAQPAGHAEVKTESGAKKKTNNK